MTEVKDSESSKAQPTGDDATDPPELSNVDSSPADSPPGVIYEVSEDDWPDDDPETSDRGDGGPSQGEERANKDSVTPADDVDLPETDSGTLAEEVDIPELEENDLEDSGMTPEETAEELGETESEDGGRAATPKPAQEARMNLRVTADNVRSGGKTVVTGIYNELSSDQKDGFLPLSQEEWEALEPVFVPSVDCRDVSWNAAATRLLVVLGPDHCGKRAAALYLASRIGYFSTLGSQVLSYRPAAEVRQISILDVIDRDEVPRGSLLLLEDIHELGIPATELRSLPTLQSASLRRGCLIILTAELDPKDLPRGVPWVSAQLGAAELREVFERTTAKDPPPALRMALESARRQVAQDWKLLTRELDSPYKVQQFSARLLEQLSSESVLNTQDLVLLAQASADPGPWQLRTWFEGLGSNGQLLAFLIVFFSDLPRTELLVLYWRAVTWVRESQPSLLEDPRVQGFEDLLRRLSTQLKGGRVRMEALHYRQEVIQQTSNHLLFLRHLAQELCERFERLENYKEWPLRKGLGLLIGHLGIHDWEWLLRTIEPLARHERWEFRTIAGYSLGPIVTQDLERQTERVLGILSDWGRADSFNLRWTAGSALWQAFQQLMGNTIRSIHGERAQKLRTRLLGQVRRISTTKWGQETRNRAFESAQSRGKVPQQKLRGRATWLLRQWRKDCGLFPLSNILRAYSEEVAPTVAEWMGSDRDWRDFSIEAMGGLLTQPSTRHLAGLSHLLDGLLASTASIGDKSPAVFDRLIRWLHREGLRDEVVKALLRLLCRATPLQRRRLRLALAKTWQHSTQARVLASRMVAESWVLDGNTLGCPSEQISLFVVDPELDDKHPVAQHLRMLLFSLTNLRLAHLGCSENEPVGRDSARSSAEKPLMLLPVLERARRWQPRLTVVLTSSRIIDFEDFASGTSDSEILIFDLGDKFESTILDGHSKVRVVGLTGGISEGHIETVESILADCWWKQFSSYRAWDRSSEVAMPSKPEVASTEDLIQYLSNPIRFRRSVLTDYFVSFLACCHKDPSGSLEQAMRWQSSNLGETFLAQIWDDSSVDHSLSVDLEAVSLGLARSFLRFASMGGPPKEPALSDGLLEGLFGKLLSSGKAESSLLAGVVRAWANKPEWVECLSKEGASIQDGLIRFFESRRADLLPHLERVAKALSVTNGSELQAQLDGTEELAQDKEELPELAKGHTRGLIFVDNGGSPQLWEIARHFAIKLIAMDDQQKTRVSILSLGNMTPKWSSGSSWKELEASHERARTIGAALESPRVDLESTSFLLILSVGEVIDLDDWRATGWGERLFHCHFSSTGSSVPLGSWWIRSSWAMRETSEQLDRFLREQHHRRSVRFSGSALPA